MLKAIFSLPPRWIKDVKENGRAAAAVVLSDPQQIMKGVGGYEGRDVWVDVQVRVEPADEAPFEAKMKCQLSPVVFGMLSKEMRVNVHYDLKDKSRVLLMDDPQTLLHSRVKK